MIRIFFCCSAFLAIRLAAAGGGDHAHAMAPGQAELGAQAAYDSRGVLWAVHRVSGHIAVSRSADEGATWSNPVLVTRAPEPVDGGGDARPKIALGAHDEIYVTWTKPLDEPYTGEIKLARSLDGGRTFSTPIVVHHDRQIITHRFDTIVVSRAGQVFVAWIDKRDLAAAGGKEADYAGAALYFAVSDDRGATFRGDFKVADHCCECCRIALAAKADGSVLAFWRHIFPPNIRDHALATLFADGHASEVRRATFEDWRIDACPHHGPAVAVDRTGRVHGVWFSGAADHHGLFYGQWSETHPEAVRRIGADSAGHGDVAVEGNLVALAWKEFAGGRTQLCGMLSRDGGVTWKKVALASASGLADHPRILLRNGRAAVFWNTTDRPLAVIPFPEP